MDALLHTTDAQTMLARFVIGCLMGGMGLAVLLRPLPSIVRNASDRTFTLGLLGAMALVRFAIFAALFIVMHQRVRGDLIGFYMPQAQAVLNGELPYRDFVSSYGPLHSILGAALLRMQQAGLAFIVFEILCDLFATSLWIPALRRFLNEEDVRRAGLLILFQPIVLWSSAVDGRNEAMVMVLLGAAFYLLGRRDFLSGLTATFTIILVKFLPLVVLPPIFLAARKRLAWLIGSALLPVLVFGFLTLKGFNVIQPLQKEGAMVTSGGFPYAFQALTGLQLPDRLVDAVALLALLGTVLWFASILLRRANLTANLWTAVVAMPALLLVLLVLSKKSYPVYIEEVAFPLAAFVAVRRSLSTSLCYTGMLIASMFVASFWFWPLKQITAAGLHQAASHGTSLGLAGIVVIVLPLLFNIPLLIDLLRHSERMPSAAA